MKFGLNRWSDEVTKKGFRAERVKSRTGAATPPNPPPGLRRCRPTSSYSVTRARADSMRAWTSVASSAETISFRRPSPGLSDRVLYHRPMRKIFHDAAGAEVWFEEGGTLQSMRARNPDELHLGRRRREARLSLPGRRGRDTTETCPVSRRPVSGAATRMMSLRAKAVLRI